MGGATVTRLPARAMTERQLQQSVTDLCRLLGLYVYHTRDSRGSAKGFPDLVIMGTGILYVELKTDRGRLTIDQVFVRDRCRAAGGLWALWRPEQWHNGEIRETLDSLCRAPTRPDARPSARIHWCPDGCSTGPGRAE